MLRDTEEEALAQLDEIINGADQGALEQLSEAVKTAGQSAKNGEGMWSTATLKDLVQYNEGFRTGLIGTAESIARRIMKLKSLGCDLVLVSRSHLNTAEHELTELDLTDGLLALPRRTPRIWRQGDPAR